MYKLYNTVEEKFISKLMNVNETVHRVREIAIENGDEDMSIIKITEAEEYIDVYCDNLILLNWEEVKVFIEKYCIKVEENEPGHYVELMMDNHRCIIWEGVQYYIPRSNSDMENMHDKLYDHFQI